MKKIFFAILLLTLTACAHSSNIKTIDNSDEAQQIKEPRLPHTAFFRGER